MDESFRAGTRAGSLNTWPAVGTGAAGATCLAVVLYDSLNVEGRIVGGVIVSKRNIIELENLHANVLQKTANIIANLQSLYINSLCIFIDPKVSGRSFSTVRSASRPCSHYTIMTTKPRRSMSSISIHLLKRFGCVGCLSVSLVQIV